jgi:YVTN family beta-propeller protein
MRHPLSILVIALGLGTPLTHAQTLVVGNKAEATVSLIDLASGEVRATLPTGEGPHEVEVSADGRWAVVSDYGVRGAPGNTLTVIDVPDAKFVRTIDLGEHSRPHGMRWLDERRLAVTTEGSRSLVVVDVPEGHVDQVIATDQEISHMVATTPDGSHAFVANIGSDSVTVIDLERAAKVDDITTGEGAEGVAVTPDGRQVWVTNRAADTITVLDAASLETIATLDCPSFPIRAEATPDGKHVIVTNARSGDLAVFATDPPRPVRTIAFDSQASDSEGRLFGDRFGTSSVPIGIEIAPDGATAWIAHANADQITVVDLREWRPVATLRAGKEPDGMDYSPLSVEADG